MKAYQNMMATNTPNHKYTYSGSKDLAENMTQSKSKFQTANPQQ